MTTQPTLSLNPIADIVVEVSPSASPRRNFNQGLIIGNSGRLPAYSRLLQVDSGWAAEMIAAGFLSTDPEYAAAQLYFGASPQPAQGWIGAQVPDALQTAIPHTGNAGTNYVQGDVVAVREGIARTITPSNGTYGTFTISGANLTSVIWGSGSETGILTIVGLTIGQKYALQLTLGAVTGQTPTLVATSGAAAPVIPPLAAGVITIFFIASATSAVFTFGNTETSSWSTSATTCYACPGSLQVTGVNAGVVTTLAKIQGSQGGGYAVADTIVTYGGSGAGLEVDVTGIGETPLDAVTANRMASNVWFPCSFAGVGAGGAANLPAAADHIAIAGYIEAANPSSLYMYTTQDPGVAAGIVGNVMLTLQNEEYSRTEGQWSSAANDPGAMAMVSMMGDCMGLNTGLAKSYFVQMFKQEVGIQSELNGPAPLSVTQVANIENANGNVYVNRGSYYNMFEKGMMANGGWFDTKLFTDMLASNIQLNVMDLFYGSPAVGQDDPGVTEIVHAVNQANQQGVTIGYIALKGTYNGTQPVLNLNPGDPMPLGYVTQAPPVSTLTSAQVSARQSPPIYDVINFKNAVQSVTIAVVVSNS